MITLMTLRQVTRRHRSLKRPLQVQLSICPGEGLHDWPAVYVLAQQTVVVVLFFFYFYFFCNSTCS